jgi:hypothetical protein
MGFVVELLAEFVAGLVLDVMGKRGGARGGRSCRLDGVRARWREALRTLRTSPRHEG